MLSIVGLTDTRMSPCDGVGHVPEDWKISKTPDLLLLMAYREPRFIGKGTDLESKQNT